eukprot:CAMPEP_0177349128 /NCGR_PEP_ID=MMETSP0368-20130122/30636_1 /TAXON_ID=447022 ORGANISM="Scrippsiella hangoei-like, Strain SHHI-4" /NCGR_SAMPLE_ID=MMETSP0368 /ASSEMBLY_ACC=CAM_ASM_000363 /LENGTH=62 /DNA_ID=CAMNT_0018810991 /DNA_START=273 /DNA_END=458 /DNA_ORIENTATION=-
MKPAPEQPPRPPPEKAPSTGVVLEGGSGNHCRASGAGEAPRGGAVAAAQGPKSAAAPATVAG